MKTKEIKVTGYERVVEAELANGVKSIIAVHNTKLGPALGGCRFYNYAYDADALTDVLRLSEGMSYKSAMAGLPLGGGKSIIIGDPSKVKSKEVLESFGEFVNLFNGSYITAKDVGIEVEDLDVIAHTTKYVRGTSAKESSGDPSPMTAYGVFQGIRAAAQFTWGNSSVKGKTVMVQGLGHVGMSVVKHLIEDGAKIIACDINQDVVDRAAKNYGIQATDINGWQTAKADIFCPCAMGAVLNETAINKLAQNGVKIVAGGANNQLVDIVEDGDRIKNAGILFAPDYIINAGGVINIACEIMGENVSQATARTSKIYDVVLEIFERAKRENKATSVVSFQMAREKLGLA